MEGWERKRETRDVLALVEQTRIVRWTARRCRVSGRAGERKKQKKEMAVCRCGSRRFNSITAAALSSGGGTSMRALLACENRENEIASEQNLILRRARERDVYLRLSISPSIDNDELIRPLWRLLCAVRR